METSLKRKALTGIIWKLMENGGSQAIQLVTSILMARLLDPEADFGPMTATVVFISVAQIFVQRGFQLALVQRKDVDETDYSSAFATMLGIAAFIILLFNLAAPAIAAYCREPRMVSVLRVLSLMLVFYAIETVQTAMISRRMEFRKIFIAKLSGAVASAAIGIAMALSGCGVWALVGQQMSNVVVMSVMLWLQTRWKPARVFSPRRVGLLLGYGWKLLLAGIMDTLYLDLSSLLIGQLHGSTEELAYYSKGKTYPQYIGANINTGIQAALFPAYSVEQNDPERLLHMLRRTVSGSALLITPLLAGLAAIAEPLISLLLTDKWLPSVPYLRLACLTYAMYPIDSGILHGFNALGRSDMYLKLEFIKKGFGAALLAVAVFVLRSPMAVAGGIALTGVFSVLVNMIPIRKLMNYRYRDQIMDLLPQFAFSLIMAAAVYMVSFLGLGKLATLFLQIPVGAGVYLGLMAVTRLPAFTYLWSSIKELLLSRRMERSTKNGGGQ